MISKIIKDFIFLTVMLSFIFFTSEVGKNKNVFATLDSDKFINPIAFSYSSSLNSSFNSATFFHPTFELQKSSNHFYSNDISILSSTQSNYQMNDRNELVFVGYNLSSNNNQTLPNKLIPFNNNSNNESQTNNCSSSNNTLFNSNLNSITPHVPPPKIVMSYNGTEYDTGRLSSYKYREGTSFLQLQMPNIKINTDLPNIDTDVIKGSCLGFIIPNYPLGLPPSSISINAYDMQGKSIKLLSNKEDWY